MNLLSLCDPDFIAGLRAGRSDRAHRQFNYAASFGKVPRNTKGFQILYQVNDLSMLIEKYHIDWKPHPKGMNALARNNPQALPRLQSRPSHQPDQASKKRVRDHEDAGQCSLLCHVECLHYFQIWSKKVNGSKSR